MKEVHTTFQIGSYKEAIPAPCTGLRVYAVCIIIPLIRTPPHQTIGIQMTRSPALSTQLLAEGGFKPKLTITHLLQLLATLQPTTVGDLGEEMRPKTFPLIRSPLACNVSSNYTGTHPPTCTCICTHMCAHIHTSGYPHRHTHAYTGAYTYINAHKHTKHVHTHTKTHAPSQTHTCMHAHPAPISTQPSRLKKG